MADTSATKRILAVAAGILITLLCVLRANHGALSVLVHPKLRGSNLENNKNGSDIGNIIELEARRRELRVVVRRKGLKGKRRRKLPELVGYGGEPDASLFPLDECEGDCDNDDEVSHHFGCFESILGSDKETVIFSLLTLRYFWRLSLFSVMWGSCAFKEVVVKRSQGALERLTMISRLISVLKQWPMPRPIHHWCLRVAMAFLLLPSLFYDAKGTAIRTLM